MALVTFVVCGTGGADLRLTTSGAVSADPLPGCAVIYIRMSVRSCWVLLVSCVTFVGRTWLLSFPVHPNKRSAASNSARASSSKQARWWCAHYHQKSRAMSATGTRQLAPASKSGQGQVVTRPAAAASIMMRGHGSRVSCGTMRAALVRSQAAVRPPAGREAASTWCVRTCPWAPRPGYR